MHIENPYHEGELFVQERVGEFFQGQRNGRAIADSIVRGALPFIAQQPIALFGSLDDEQNVWASVLLGTPGFMTAPDERTVEFDLPQTARNPNDPLWSNIERNPEVGTLIIELTSRRRLRINGGIHLIAPDRLQLNVVQFYPNCPKYIQRRHLKAGLGENGAPAREPLRGRALEHEHQTFIASADTVFVASAHPEHGVDVSHRGGNPGFVHILDDRTLRVPDYVGNSMYNTLGNFVVNPRAGLVFIDFAASRTLQLIGRPEIQWELDDPTDASGGTKRFWDFEIERWLETDLPRKLQWEFLDYSPHNPSP